jgi:ATP-dependent Clp protease ATP-binding subunit ClpC
MFERFTERARQVVVLAQEEARALKHNYIGTEHILLGLLREEQGLAARVLESLEISLEEVRAMVARIIGEGDDMTTGQMPFTPRAKKVLELSLREALHLGHDYIGTEHILLGLVRENSGVASRILLDFDASAKRVARAVVEMLGADEAAVARYAEGFSHELGEPSRSFRSRPSPLTFVRGGRLEQSKAEIATRAFFTGWLLFGIAFGLGLLLGWLLWG